LSWLPGFIARIAQLPLLDLGVERGGLEQLGDAADVEDEEAVGAYDDVKAVGESDNLPESRYILSQLYNIISSQDAAIESLSIR